MTGTSIEDRALHQHIRMRTVRLLDLTDKSAGGSAVTVKLGNRYFLATAAHVIPMDHEIRVLVGEAEASKVSKERRFDERGRSWPSRIGRMSPLRLTTPIAQRKTITPVHSNFSGGLLDDGHERRSGGAMKRSTLSSSIGRRDFLRQAAVGGIALAASRFSVLSAVERSKKNSLRVIAYNVYQCTGWPKDRTLGKKATASGQMPDRFAMELALHDPDIINFSESPDESVVEQIAKRLGMNYVRFPSGGNWPGTLLSRFEIVDPQNVPLVGGDRSQDLFTRHWGRATIRLPNGESLIVHSAHLFPGTDSAIRVREISAMLKSMQDDLRADRSMLLIGDLNHGPSPPEYPMWIKAGWVDTFASVGKGEGLTIKADGPTSRIDYVMATGPIARSVVESRPLFEGAFRTNTADPSSFALSDHLPQLAVFDLNE